ncbi:hypothetical protein CW304_04960 [Bacillus sp. UFRGS-B20]|nr:hypothetical protein CW304_04960 [Bacillus sp. UFRGS-B20]
MYAFELNASIMIMINKFCYLEYLQQRPPFNQQLTIQTALAPKTTLLIHGLSHLVIHHVVRDLIQFTRVIKVLFACFNGLPMSNCTSNTFKLATINTVFFYQRSLPRFQTSDKHHPCQYSSSGLDCFRTIS